METLLSFCAGGFLFLQFPRVKNSTSYILLGLLLPCLTPWWEERDCACPGNKQSESGGPTTHGNWEGV